ncbi:MAG TPA: cytochrome b [Gammaproteobacteria bacterium]|nr:cytochrome b [Gammaproteobacteria bacterium]
MVRDDRESYGSVTKTLHWLLVLLIAGMLVVGYVMADMPDGDPTKGFLIHLHASTGFLVLVLGGLLILWRLVNPRPSLASLPGWQRAMAHTTHGLLYLILILQPILGILLINSSGHPVNVYWLFNLPLIAGKSKAAAHTVLEIHEVVAGILIGVVALHLLGALSHQFVSRDGVLQRMLPGGKRPQ